MTAQQKRQIYKRLNDLVKRKGLKPQLTQE